MTPEILFRLVNGLAMIGWLILIFMPAFRSDKLITGIIVTLLAMVYTYFVFTEFRPADLRNFSSLPGVTHLFQDQKILLAGWVHYLAFDLMVGLWIKNNARKHHINHWLAAPCLLFTFLLGPMGLLIYLLIRWLKTKKYFSENF